MGEGRGARIGTLSGTLACLLLVGPGCGQRAVQQPTASAPAQSTAVPLPEWAPKDPSPAFLRAAKVLKPIPPEILESFGEKAGPAVQAVVARYGRTYTSAWEFLGTLSDQEIERLRASGVVRVPVRSMTKPQRRALDGYFDAWREAMAGQQQLPGDWLVLLYKDGAKEDLSNVDAGFARDNSDRGVNIQFWITRSDGSTSTPSNTVAFM